MIQLDMEQINNTSSIIGNGPGGIGTLSELGGNFKDLMSANRTGGVDSTGHQFKYFDQLVFPEGDKDINELMEKHRNPLLFMMATKSNP